MTSETESSGYRLAKRSVRRLHCKRLKQKRRQYWGGYELENKRLTGKKFATPKPTSTCMCCINVRKIEGPTRQERLADQLHDFESEK